VARPRGVASPQPEERNRRPPAQEHEHKHGAANPERSDEFGIGAVRPLCAIALSYPPGTHTARLPLALMSRRRNADTN